MPRCVVPFCGNTSASGGGLFTFPANPEINLQWRVNMNMMKRKEKKSPTEPGSLCLWVNSPYSRICGKHFEENCFVISRSFADTIASSQPRRLQLKPGAIPTIFNEDAIAPASPRARPKRRWWSVVRSAFEKRSPERGEYPIICLAES